MPSIANQHIDRYLTDMSVGIGVPELICDIVAPPIYVGKRSDKYRIYGKEFVRVPANKGVTPDGELTPGLTYALSNDTYYCVQHGFHEKLPREVLAQTDNSPQDLRQNSLFLTKTVTETLREQAVATLLQASATYTATDATLSLNNYTEGTTNATNYWDNASSTGHPIKEFFKLKSAIRKFSGYLPNLAWFSYDAWVAFQNHADLIDRFKYTKIGSTNEEIAASILQVDEVVIGKAIINSTNEGQTQALSDIWTNSAGMMYKFPSPTNQITAEGSKPRAFSQFIWKAAELGAASDGTIVNNWVQANENFSEYVEYRKNSDVKTTFGGAGALIRNILSGTA